MKITGKLLKNLLKNYNFSKLDDYGENIRQLNPEYDDFYCFKS